MEQNSNIYILVNYTLGNLQNVETLQRLYPNLIFTRITPGLYTVQIPSGSEAEFEQLNTDINFIIEPTVYGLNTIANALEVSNISVFHDYPYGELRGRGVLIGFIDTGIDYTNSLFQNADGTTRIVSIWDQNIPGDPPIRYNYGTVYNEADINEALQSSTPLAIVPSTDEIGHGTFLAGIAAGNDQSDGAGFSGGAPDADIVMVKLRQASDKIRQYYMIEDGVPAYQSNDILTGINYLLELSFSLNQPLVVCVGLGNNYGAHNGTDILEGYLEGLSSASNVINVIAAGNEASSGHHYSGNVISGSSESIEINVSDNEKGFLIFLWTDVPNRLTIAVRSPLGQVIERIPIKSQQTQRFQFNLEEARLEVRYLYPAPLSGGQEISIRLITPTPGIWTLVVYGDSVIDGQFHMWLPRRNFIKDTTRFLKSDPDTTVQIPGTQVYSIVVGAYDALDDSIYVASGRGPTTNQVIKPDIIAPGVNVEGPMPGGGFTTYVGTSTAAAITASASALLLEWAVLNQNLPEMNTRIARGIFIKGATRQRDVIYPNNIEGYGRLDLRNSIANI